MLLAFYKRVKVVSKLLTYLHHLAAISMAAVYTVDAAHIADGVIGLKQRALAASGPAE